MKIAPETEETAPQEVENIISQGLRFFRAAWFLPSILRVSQVVYFLRLLRPTRPGSCQNPSVLRAAVPTRLDVQVLFDDANWALALAGSTYE